MKRFSQLVSLIGVIFILLAGMAPAFTPTAPKSKVDISQIPLDEALIMGDANAPKQVIVFTDPDCRPYCVNLHQEIKKILERRKDIVFYIKLYPLKMLNIDSQIFLKAYEKSKAIICEKSISLLDDAFAGKNIPAPRCNTTEVENNLILGKELGIKGTPTIILPDGSVAIGYKAADNLISLIDTSAVYARVKQPTPIATEKSVIKSDVDELPAIKAKPNKNSYAIVIGIENYRQKLPKVDYAAHDAQTVTEYLTKVMGYPEENVVTLLNDRALKSDFEKYFEKWLSNNVEKDGSVFIYYSGHGAPNPKTGDAYLVPYDGDPTFIAETGYSLKRLYESLGKLQAKEIIVALDSCFSGAGGRSVIAKGSRPLVMTMESLAIPSKVAVLSASSGDQISSTYEEKGHGLFTYFMLKGIKEGSADLESLYNFLRPNVEKTARRIYNNEQTPQLIAPKGKQIMLLKE